MGRNIIDALAINLELKHGNYCCKVLTIFILLNRLIILGVIVIIYRVLNPLISNELPFMRVEGWLMYNWYLKRIGGANLKNMVKNLW